MLLIILSCGSCVYLITSINSLLVTLRFFIFVPNFAIKRHERFIAKLNSTIFSFTFITSKIMAKLLFASSSTLIFLIFLCVIKLATSQSPLVSNFCHKGGIQDPNFCLIFLGSDPRSKTTKSVHYLEGITIYLGSEYAKAVTTKALSLLQREKDPKVHAALSACFQ